MRRPVGATAAAVATLGITLALGFWQVGDGDTATAAGGGANLEAREFLLRLHDLPLGYRYSGGSPEFPGGSTSCHAIEPANPQTRLARFLDRYSPAGCATLYARYFRVSRAQPAPFTVGTGALDAGSVAGAEAGLAVSRELLSHLLGDELPREAPPPETIGEATRLYRWEHAELFAPSEEHSSSFLVWRSGDIVASIFVSGGSVAANDRTAVELARLQQSHIEAPTPYTPAEEDDTEVALEDPGLEVPIYWLGRSLAARSGLPRLRLLDTNSTTIRALNVPRVGLLYVDHLRLDPAEGIFLNLWSRGQWNRLRSQGATLPASLRCATTRELKLPRGSALILAGFERARRARGGCPERRHRTYTARIHLGGAIATLETVKICGVCAEAGTGPYDSFKGMATIARGLEQRPRPAYPTASP